MGGPPETPDEEFIADVRYLIDQIDTALADDFIHKKRIMAFRKRLKRQSYGEWEDKAMTLMNFLADDNYRRCDDIFLAEREPNANEWNTFLTSQGY